MRPMSVHFVHSYSVILWKEQVYQNAGAVGVDPAFRVGNVRATTVLLVLAIGSLSQNKEQSDATSNELDDGWI